jgi:hypothetical protein
MASCQHSMNDTLSFERVKEFEKANKNRFLITAIIL